MFYHHYHNSRERVKIKRWCFETCYLDRIWKCIGYGKYDLICIKKVEGISGVRETYKVEV